MTVLSILHNLAKPTASFQRRPSKFNEHGAWYCAVIIKLAVVRVDESIKKPSAYSFANILYLLMSTGTNFVPTLKKWKT